MTLRPLIVCLLLASACASPPAPRPAWQDLPRASPEDVQRTLWKEKVRPVQLSWGRMELGAFLDGIRPPAPHLDGGGFSFESAPMTYFDLYALDEVFALYVVWKDEDIRKGIRSTEVVAFPDLRSRIDPELYEAVAAIHRSPSAQRGLEFNPLRLIRAVNALQPLGKEKALKALWEYERLAHKLTLEESHKYQVDEYRLLPIVQLLFESPSGGMPEFRLGGGDVVAPEGKAWPLFPIVLAQEVPFMMISGYVLGGIPQDAADHLRLKLGPIRSAPLAPRVTALEAVDELTQSGAWKSLRLGPGNEGRKKWQVRRQALGALSSVFAARPEESSNDCCLDPTEAQWRATVERAKSSGLIWSPEIQDFILGR